MTGHTPWSEIRRKVETRTAQNGSRLGEHRKRRVPATNWLVLVGILAAIFALSPWLANAQDYQAYNEGTGLIVQQAEICFAPEINSDTIKLLNTWQRLVNEIEAYERGGAVMNKEDALLGQLLYENHMCATVADFYHVVVVRHAEGYALLKFDMRHGLMRVCSSCVLRMCCLIGGFNELFLETQVGQVE